jgi:hypothetical protein
MGLLFASGIRAQLPLVSVDRSLRVDILNMLGLSMMLIGILCWLSAGAPTHPCFCVKSGFARPRNLGPSFQPRTCSAIVTPLLWTTHRPSRLPWPLETYINGVHVFGTPQPWLFPLFPWSAFAFAGLAVGFFLFTGIARRMEGITFAALGAAGALACFLSIRFDHSNLNLYPVYDYWHTSPNFFLLRCGVLLIILFCVRLVPLGLPKWDSSPIIQLSKTSLLVYWVHIEFVYGWLSIPKRQSTASFRPRGLIIIFLAMLAVSMLRTGGRTGVQSRGARRSALACLRNVFWRLNKTAAPV